MSDNIDEKKPHNGKRLKYNILLNIVKAVMALIFPLITYPYASKILLPEGIGKYNYVISIIGYFQLFAGLGVSIYAITEGSKIRDNRRALSIFSTEVLLINIISTVLTYVLLVVLVVLGLFHGYEKLLLICSITILFNTIGVSWIYNIAEDFLYVTLRTIGFQLLSLVLLFAFVKTQNDIYNYAALTVVATAGANLCNIFGAKKYVDFFSERVRDYKIKRHIKPILLLFFASAASTVYLNSDKIMLGVIHDVYTVGIYSTAVKLISVVSAIIVAFRDVLLPRLSYYLFNDFEVEAKKLIITSLSGIYMFVFPIITGIVLLNKEMIVLISSIDYISASSSLCILSVQLLFSPISAFIAYEVLVPLKKTHIVSLSTSIAAIENIVLNLILIPSLSEQGAAIATVVSELSVFIILLFNVRKIVELYSIRFDLVQYTIGSLSLGILIFILKHFIVNIYCKLAFSIIVGGLLYIFILLLQKNRITMEITKSLLKMFIRTAS